MRVGLAVRAAFGAVVAWLLVLPMGGLADDYPYYAPMGALVVVTSTVASSWQESWRSAFAMLSGAVIALLTTPLPGVVQLVAVVGIGTWVGAWHVYGTVSTWVPITGLFVMIFGNDSPWVFGAGFVLLTSFGALVGLAVNLLWPPMPFGAARGSMNRLSDALVEQLDDLVEGLQHDEPPSIEEWYERSRLLDPDLQAMRYNIGTASESRWANWRALWWRGAAGELEDRSQRLDTLTFLVEDLTRTLTTTEHAGVDAESVALGARLRGRAGRAISEVADLIRDIRDGAVGSDGFERPEQALQDFLTGIREERETSQQDLVMASTMAGTLRRILQTLE